MMNPSQACALCEAGRTKNQFTMMCDACDACAAERTVRVPRPIRFCAYCPTIVTGHRKLCEVHSAERARERGRVNAALWRTRHPQRARATAQRYEENNRDKHRARAKRQYWANPAAAMARTMAWQKRKQLFRPAVAIDVMGRVARMVPAMPGRDDVVQRIMLALLEGQTTLESIERGGLRSFISGHYAESFEQRGFAVSLSVPRFDGRPWDDVLEAGDQSVMSIQRGQAGR